MGVVVGVSFSWYYRRFTHISVYTDSKQQTEIRYNKVTLQSWVVEVHVHGCMHRVNTNTQTMLEAPQTAWQPLDTSSHSETHLFVGEVCDQHVGHVPHILTRLVLKYAPHSLCVCLSVCESYVMAVGKM